MKLYRTHLHLTFCILALLSSKLVVAQACSPSTSFSINATGSQSITSPFKPPTGPLSNGSSNWIWNIATESHPTTPPNFSVRQALWLDIQPPQDLLSPELGFLGCGLIAHGLKTSITQKGQDDDGTCGSVLGAKCIAALLNDTKTFGPLLSASEAVPIEQICGEFATQQGWKEHGVPSDCSDAFSDQAWVETFRMHFSLPPYQGPPVYFLHVPNAHKLAAFASPELASKPCVSDPNFHGNASQPLHTWAASTYSAANMTAYDNLTTSVTPLISVMFANHTTDFNYTLGYTQSQLSCLRPSNVQSGSQKPTGVPTSHAHRSRVEATWLFLIAMGLMNAFGGSL